MTDWQFDTFEFKSQKDWADVPGSPMVVSNYDNATRQLPLRVVKMRIANPYTEPPHVEAILYTDGIERTEANRKLSTPGYSTSQLMQDYHPYNAEARELWLLLASAAKLLASE